MLIKKLKSVDGLAISTACDGTATFTLICVSVRYQTERIVVAGITGRMSHFRKHFETVLVVEDEGLVRLDAAESLREAGFAVLEATDAAEALEIFLGREDIDVLFTDINMPGDMDGLELARRVHDCRPAVRLVLTSGAIKPTPDQIPDDGAFISKPYSPEAVTRAVQGPDASCRAHPCAA